MSESVRKLGDATADPLESPLLAVSPPSGSMVVDSGVGSGVATTGAADGDSDSMTEGMAVGTEVKLSQTESLNSSNSVGSYGLDTHSIEYPLFFNNFSRLYSPSVQCAKPTAKMAR